MRKIFLLVRAKRFQNKHDRLKEILNSRCFSVLRDRYGKEGFMEFATKKVIPVSGDMISEGLGMPAEERKMLIEEVHVVINSAASVSF